MQFSILLAFVLNCVYWIYRRKLPQLNVLDLAVCAYLLSVMFSWLSVAGLQSDPLRMSGIWPIAGYFAARGPLTRVIQSENMRRLWLVTAFLTACYGIGQYFLGYDLMRGQGLGSVYHAQADNLHFAVICFFDRHNTYAVSAMVSLSFLLTSALYSDSRKKRLIHITLLIPVFISILLTQSRICWLMLALLIVILLIIFKKRLEIWVVSVICLVISIAYFVLDTNVVERLYNFADFSGFSSRREIFLVALSLIAERPFSGWGFGRFFVEADFLFSLTAPYINVRSGTHNEILDQLSGGSLMLLFAYINTVTMIFVNVTSYYYKRIRPLVWPLGFSLACIVISGTGHNVMVDGELSLVFWCFCGMLASLDQEINKKNQKYVFSV